MNVNDFRMGHKVVSRSTRVRRLSKDFPGWGAEGYQDHLLDTPAGIVGVVEAVNSHGSNPWTRYVIRFEDGSRGIDLVPGEDFDWAGEN